MGVSHIIVYFISTVSNWLLLSQIEQTLPYSRVRVAKVCCCSPVEQLEVQSLQEIMAWRCTEPCYLLLEVKNVIIAITLHMMLSKCAY